MSGTCHGRQLFSRHPTGGLSMKRITAALLVTAASLAAPLQAADEVSLNKDDMKWGDVPPVLPKGAKLAVLHGDPSKSGPFTLRLNAPANYKIAPHWHSQAEDLTIISGALYLGMGDRMDTKAAHALKAGGFHYCRRRCITTRSAS